MAQEDPERRADTGGTGPCARLSREVLDRLATTEVRDRIVTAALEDAGLTEIPEDAPTFGSFACGSLRDAVERALGDEAASAVITDLSPVFAQESTTTSSGVRRRKGASLAPPRLGAPVVVVASADAAHVDALVSRLKDRAKVIAAFDVFALLSAASRHVSSPLTLLLDDAMPAMRPSTLATLGRVLPPGTRIITWGAGGVAPEPRKEAPSVHWVRLGPVEDVEAVADVCVAMWSGMDPTSPPMPRPEPGRRVVVAHDDASWRARVSRMLTEVGYEVLSAPDGFMALERCIDEGPSAVVAALHMAALDGAQLATLLRSRFEEEAPPVILVCDGDLPEPPAGVMAMIRADAIEQDLLAELAAWIGPR